MVCGHNEMSIQAFNKKNNGFKTTYDIFYFLFNCLSQIKYRFWSYCFCSDYQNQTKCKLC